MSMLFAQEKIRVRELVQRSIVEVEYVIYSLREKRVVRMHKSIPIWPLDFSVAVDMHRVLPIMYQSVQELVLMLVPRLKYSTRKPVNVNVLTFRRLQCSVQQLRHSIPEHVNVR